MMKKLLIPIFLFLFLLFWNCKTEKQATIKTTILQGIVVDREASNLLSLITKNGDYRTNSIEIPIVNGKFSYTLSSDVVQEYAMAFNDELEKGSWRSVDFYNDADTIKFTLYPREKFDNNIISGGNLNKKTTAFNKEVKRLFYDKVNTIYKTKVDSLQKNNQWDSKEATELFNTIRSENDFGKKNELYKKLELLRKEKKDLTPQARVWQNKIDSIFKEYAIWKNNFIRNDHTIFGYSQLLDELFSNTYKNNFDINTVENNLKNYQTTFKNHPYTSLSKNLINGIKNAKVGGYYSDFLSKTTDDKIVKVSPQIVKSKLTLIDLWAPWCGPCIAKSKALKPEYSKLNNKGLEVFAVIGGIDKKEKYIETKEKYQYPWQINYELNNEFSIWNKYNISRSGGSQFLVNTQGKILAINPKPKEIDSILTILQIP